MEVTAYECKEAGFDRGMICAGLTLPVAMKSRTISTGTAYRAIDRRATATWKSLDGRVFTYSPFVRETLVSLNVAMHYFRSRSMRITLLVLAEKVMVVVHSPLLVSPAQIY